MSTNFNDVTKTTRLTATVTLDIYPRDGQSPEQAREELAAALYHHLTDWDYDFREDYGATIAEIEDGSAREAMYGYEGPYVTDVDVTCHTSI